MQAFWQTSATNNLYRQIFPHLAHISKYRRNDENLPESSLILLDEVGTRTDPDEGSALGVAIVDYFRSKGSQVIASTHHKGLKIYAANDENVINASVEFNENASADLSFVARFAGAGSVKSLNASEFYLKSLIMRLNLLTNKRKETEQFC